jgi:integrase
MSVYKREGVYWIDVRHGGRRYRRSTGQKSRKAAVNMAAAAKTKLAQGDFGIFERDKPVDLRTLSKRFKAHIEKGAGLKASTVKHYKLEVEELRRFKPLADCRIDRIDSGLIQRFTEQRLSTVGPASVNRSLAVLKRMLRLAQEWNLLDRVPKIRMVKGEKHRDYVLSRKDEEKYLSTAPRLLADAALLMLDTGLRSGEALALTWQSVTLDSGGESGAVFVAEGKTRYARRSVPLTARAARMLKARKSASASPFVFDGMKVSSLSHLHRKHADSLGLGGEFVVHSLRHSYLTRMGELADAFTLKLLAGHADISTTSRYVHPETEAAERAVRRLDEAASRQNTDTPEVTERVQ